jgi:hypothetical protein
MNNHTVPVSSPAALPSVGRREPERSEGDRNATDGKAGADPRTRPDPEVVAQAKRRRFTGEYKQRILTWSRGRTRGELSQTNVTSNLFGLLVNRGAADARGMANDVRRKGLSRVGSAAGLARKRRRPDILARSIPGTIHSRIWGAELPRYRLHASSSSRVRASYS